MTKNDLVKGEVYVAMARNVRYVFKYNETNFSDWIILDTPTPAFNKRGQFIDNPAMTHYEYPSASEKAVFLASEKHNRYIPEKEALKMFPQDGKVASYNLI